MYLLNHGGVMFDIDELLMALDKAFDLPEEQSVSTSNDEIINQLFLKQGEQSVINFIKQVREGSKPIKELLTE